ncbi:3-ketoacyl-(acyl-carrier) reductase [Ceratobasidium theobromae]|uniref:3-ketoacyl-(Acyl-carrier) reductase n=1 Tax=Ceratobasidium theobromae TaxID=1582974 RepID=A0A5N5QKU8_9AGAM|nr:3-ketoacyl-(acyl-carrier) reductase [Ceratobasidium theobromae]
MARVAVVTGAAQGIGRAIALRLAADGVDVAVADLSSKRNALEQLAKEIEATGRQAISVIVDVSNEREVQEMVAQTVKALGGLDIMVANAGILVSGSIMGMTDEALDKIMNVNVKGVIYCYRAAAAQMIKQGRGGRIIGASSVAGMQGALGNTPYSISKFAVRAITQSAALEWGQYNITVNAYAPGVVDTPMVAEAGGGAHGENFVKVMMVNAGLKREAQPEEIAGPVAFLASESASYITGQTLSVNGGFLLT